MEPTHDLFDAGVVVPLHVDDSSQQSICLWYGATNGPHQEHAVFDTCNI